VSKDAENGLHILLRFMMNVEGKSYSDFSHFSSENRTSSSRSYCSTISPETQKVKRLQSQWDLQDDDWSSVFLPPSQCTSAKSNEKFTRKMSLDRAQSHPVITQSSTTSSQSISEAEYEISSTEQLLHIHQPCTIGTEEISTPVGDSVNSMT